MGSRQRQVSGHRRPRRRDSQDRRATGHLDSPASGAGRRAGSLAAAARSQHPRSDDSRGAREGRRRSRAPATVELRADQARLHDLRSLRPLGLDDGIGADPRRLDVRGRPVADDRGSDRRAVSHDPRRRRRRARHRLQHRESSVRRTFRDLSRRRRHQRHRLGADAQDGRQHAGVSRTAARRVLRRRRRLRRRHQGGAVDLQSAMARSGRAQRHDDCSCRWRRMRSAPTSVAI